MSNVAYKKKSYDELYAELVALPANKIGEIIDGQLHVMPRPNDRHSNATTALGAVLFQPFVFNYKGGPGGWVFRDEPELHLRHHVLVPDIAGWRSERWVTPAGLYQTIVPDWVCEILSPSTESFDRNEKASIYSELGILHMWLIDVNTCTIEAYDCVKNKQKWRLLGSHQGDIEAKIKPFDAVALELSWLWKK
jgi:Uma2 family endonuclease